MLDTAVTGRMDATLTRQAGPSATPNVLLACCDKAENRRLRECLSDIYHLFAVATPSELFAVLENHPIHLVIINRQTGTLREGMQTCSRLKSIPHLAHLPVLFLIPPNNADARIGCLQSGADVWMEKPLSRDHLRAQIRNILANRHRIHSYFRRTVLFKSNPALVKKEDCAFLSRLNSIIMEHLPDPGLNVDGLARLMNISLPTLYRKIKSVSDTTPNELINMARLNKAGELLAFGGYKVFQIVKMVGFHSRSNFGKAFLKQYGLTPREYQQLTSS